MCGERKMSVGEAGGNGLRKRAEPMTLLLLDATLLPRAKGTGSHWLALAQAVALALSVGPR